MNCVGIAMVQVLCNVLLNRLLIAAKVTDFKRLYTDVFCMMTKLSNILFYIYVVRIHRVATFPCSLQA